ncbi:hypothetical protein [Ramlibacter sp. AN1133]|uniref:hypothetical protein n=1 Tax=Ramlibacter sp. AN1133 TaxID=3133429 RepID=UPI0030BD6621
MATTAPVLPADEAPLDAATLDAFLRHMSTEMVLVGGQALAFWMQRYGIHSEGAAISNDGDALGSVRQARYLAEKLRAALLLPEPTSLTSLVAQLRIPVAGTGKVRNIDVLHLLYTTSGLKKSNAFTRRVERNAVTVKMAGGIDLRIMHPLDLLEARAHNAVGLTAQKGEHVVTQARWAIAVAREALIRIASDVGRPDRAGACVQRVFRLWKSSVGQRLWKEHKLCVLDAIDGEELLRYRDELQQQLATVARERPAGDAADSNSPRPREA